MNTFRTPEELIEYIKNRKYFCELCRDLKEKILKKGIVAIKDYEGMQCGGIEDMKNRYWDLDEKYRE
jgi:hypothetical protein